LRFPTRYLSSPAATLTMAPPLLTKNEEFQKLLDSTDTFLLDCDGVIYHGPVVVPGVPETLKLLRDAGV
jgi:4-nitrophenyl phosphatase